MVPINRVLNTWDVLRIPQEPEMDGSKGADVRATQTADGTKRDVTDVTDVTDVLMCEPAEVGKGVAFFWRPQEREPWGRVRVRAIGQRTR